MIGAVFADQELLTDILTYHVAAGSLEGVGGSRSTVYSDAPGITVSQSASGVVVNGDVPVLATDLAASNGTIHVIKVTLSTGKRWNVGYRAAECWAEIS